VKLLLKLHPKLKLPLSRPQKFLFRLNLSLFRLERFLLPKFRRRHKSKLATELPEWCSFNRMNEQEKKSSFKPDLIFWGMVFCILGLFVLVAMPNYVSDGRNGPGGKSNACINNLRQIDAAANQFALDHGKTNGEAINYPDDLTPYIKPNKDGEIPSCPSGGIYSLKKVGEIPTCSLGTTVTPAHVLP
jgi:hypothetical protein